MEAGALDYLVKGEITARLLERALRYALRLGTTLAELRRLATRDALTGLLNRGEFDRLLAEEVERARRLGQPLGLVLADVDHFKRINDTRGHAAGDAALRVLAERIPAAVRGIDRVARVGGDEFGVILPAADAAGALEVARRICAAAEKAGFTVSAGAASLAGAECSGDVLLAAADRALYAAKGGGRNCAVGSTESLRSGTP
jgi:diguanylate cyclase (GGDEF)-like protein